MCRRAEHKGSRLTDGDILNGVYRNFGGICPDANEKVMKAFEKQFKVHKYNEWKPTAIKMIKENLKSKTLERFNFALKSLGIQDLQKSKNFKKKKIDFLVFSAL